MILHFTKKETEIGGTFWKQRSEEERFQVYGQGNLKEKDHL